MKTVLILRHAKSSWDDPTGRDHDRPLNARGKRDAPRMGELIAAEALVPQLIITSSALRARTTGQKVAVACGYQGAIEEEPGLYAADATAYLARLRRVADTVDTVLIVGHNPDVEELILLLSGRHERMPTAALAVLRLSIGQWAALEATGRHDLVNVWRPRELD